MTWTRGRRELVLSGRLPLEQGAAFVAGHIWNIAKPQRAHDKQTGTLLEWQQYTADALVSLVRCGGTDGGSKRSPTTLIVHLSDDASPLLEGAGPISPETAERLACDARRLAIATSCTRAWGAAPPTPSNAPCTSAQAATANTRLHRQPRGEAHHLTPVQDGGKTELDNLILLCPRHHKHLHDHHIHTSGHNHQPRFSDQTGRPITTNQPHAPPR